LTGALLRYRALAYTVGVGLLVLVLIGIPLQVIWNNKSVVEVVGPIHGFLYIFYLIAALDLARRARFTLPQMLMMVGAGLLPFLAFIIERKITGRIEADLATPRLPLHVFVRETLASRRSAGTSSRTPS
jgi:integral membrane protein